MHMKLSLVVPCYNEEENVAAFQQAVIAAFQGCGYSYEIIFVDDGSSDGTLTQLEALYRSQACPVSVVSFSRNFGKEAGLYAGLRHAKGAYISLIDADLQQRPELVRQMVEILDTQPEYDIVAARTPATSALSAGKWRRASWRCRSITVSPREFLRGWGTTPASSPILPVSGLQAPPNGRLKSYSGMPLTASSDFPLRLCELPPTWDSQPPFPRCFIF